MDLNPPISFPISLMHYLSPLESDEVSGNVILREKEIQLRGYATFDRLQLIIISQPILPECTVTFTNERLLMSRKLKDKVVRWGVERKYIRATENCGLFSNRVRLILKDPTLQEEDHFELKFPEANFPKRKNAFITILKMLDLCQACEEDRLEDFQTLLQRNLKLVNLVRDFEFSFVCVRADCSSAYRFEREHVAHHGMC